MDRRTWLKVGGMGALGLGLGACAPRVGPVSARPMARLVPVRASWDRIIRTTVGLRPYRPSGFVVRADRLGDKTLIHNYGHGGAGMSTSWGTGQLAAELALEHDARRAAVIGCGVVGLTTARQLQRRGFDVTIYARDVPPNTTSNMSLAGFTPTSGLVSQSGRTPAWDAQFRRAVEIAYDQLQLLVGSEYGVSWIDQYRFSNSPRGVELEEESVEDPEADEGRGRSPLLPAHIRTGWVELGPGEHPFPSVYASRRPSMRIEPSIYLEALVRDFYRFGGRVVIRAFETPRDLVRLTEPIVVNCTGLGAGALFGDDEIIPVKGQLTVLVPQPEVDYMTFGGVPGSGPRSSFGIHMMPRSDGIVLGGTSERGVGTLEPDQEARREIVEGHIRLFSAMRGLAV